MDKVQNREWDSGKASEARERRGPPPKKTDNYNRPQSAANQPPKQSNSTKPTPNKPASSIDAPSINEPSVDAPSVNPDEPSSNEPITAPEIPDLSVPATIFSPDQETNYSAWFTPSDTTVPNEAFVDPFSSATQEKSDYSEWFTEPSAAQEKSDYSDWFTGDTSNATQNFSDWSASQSGTQIGSNQTSNSRGDRGKGRGRGRGRGRGEGGRGSSNTAPRRGNEKEAPKPS